MIERIWKECRLPKRGQINTRTQRKQREAVAKWQASGLSQAEFCRREGIPQWSLSEWKRRYRKEQQGIRAGSPRARRRTPFTNVEFAAIDEPSETALANNNSEGRSVKTFIPVVPHALNKLIDQSRAGTDGSVVAELVISGGSMRIDVLSGADANTLRNLLTVLMEGLK
jgi:hypothetical protein